MGEGWGCYYYRGQKEYLWIVLILQKGSLPIVFLIVVPLKQYHVDEETNRSLCRHWTSTKTNKLSFPFCS